MNYQQLGDAPSANKAIDVELQASREHKLKAWHSNESYYRKKYAGNKRFKAFIDWLSFGILDFIWGDGESALKLLRATLIMFALMTVIDVMEFRDRQRIDSYLNAFGDAPQIFFGTLSPTHSGAPYLTAVVLVRLTGFGFLMSMITKRLNRR
jgi:hypothetical protein